MSQSSPEQDTLFPVEPAWRELWGGMPEYTHEDLTPWRSVTVHFASADDRAAFSRAVGQRVTSNTKSIWYPEAVIGTMRDKRYRSEDSNYSHPRYPVYIISKGRWESRKTARALDKIGVSYRIAIEPQEYDAYAAVIDPAKILVLPFSNLGQGSIPARNWVWDHATASGADRHWILDDNISGFFRHNRNLKTPVSSGAIFRVAEDFTERFTNVPMSGFNYFMFVKRKEDCVPPYTLNTRIYSCILLSNRVTYRWRGRYNEDTDLSVRILKDGNCTILFNAFLAGKEQTMTMKGGNTDELYEGDGRLKMAQSLVDQHPDVTTITWKFQRPQHQVDYSRFKKNKLILKPNVYIPPVADEYGMVLEIDPSPNPIDDVTESTSGDEGEAA